MAFPRRRNENGIPEDPEMLYRVLAETNDGPPALWLHQGEVLRTWAERHQNSADVAIELPTGAGKTLVGGLIAEYRRLAHRERTAIVCPTRQLARQTAARLTEYGISNALLVGKVSEWNPATRTRYTRGDAVAVTVYAHVFNSNPAISDADLLVFDDAHAAEQSVARPWTITIEREWSLYVDLLSLLDEALDPLVMTRLRTDEIDPRLRPLAYLAAPNGVAARATEIEAVLSSAASINTGPQGLAYSLTKMQGHIDRALVYVSHAAILIRPLIAPTATHDAYAGARQRVYMSATLGHGGELERAFGRSQIARIPVPRGWDRQGTGRRFITIPSVTTDLRGQDAIDAWVRELGRLTGRSLILAASERQARQAIDNLVAVDTTVLRAEDVEEDLDVFTRQERAALVLANRYDGIDLPDDDCRLVVMTGLPARGDLQERFLHDALGAVEVLRERVRARFAQGVGRATRNVKDFAAVVLLGDELINYVVKREVLSALHPELQAEIAWGFEESQNNTGDELRGDLGEFFDQTSLWQQANADIIERRHEAAVETPAGTAALADAASAEVEAWTAAWQGDWDRAVDRGREVIDRLSGGRDVQRYSALWHYLLANWVLRLDEAPAGSANEYLRKARAAGRGTTWLDHLVSAADEEQLPATVERDDADVAAIEHVLATSFEIGRNRTFETLVTNTRSDLLGTEATAYESALVALGRLAGAESEGNGNAAAAPDAMWRFANHLWVSWEAKSEAEPIGELGANDVREAGSHLRYMEDRYGERAPRSSYGLIVTPQERVHRSAIAVAETHLWRVKPAAVLCVFDRVVRAWRRLRALDAGTDFDAAWDTFRAEGALPSQWTELLCTDPLVRRDY